MLNKMNVGTRLYCLLGFLLMLLLLIGYLGLHSAGLAVGGLERVYKDRVLPLKGLKVIADEYAVNIVDTSHKVRNGNLSWIEGRENVLQAQASIADRWESYLAHTLVKEEVDLVAEVKPLMNKADFAITQLLEILNRQDMAALEIFTINDLYPAIDPISGKFGELSDIQLVVAEKEYLHDKKSYEVSRLMSILLIVGGFIVSGILGFLITRSITVPVNRMVGYVEMLAKGDFTSKIGIEQQDEIGRMAQALSATVQQLGDMIKEIVHGVNTLSSSSTELSAVSEQLAGNALDTSSRSQSVAASAEETSTNMNSVSAAMEESSSNVGLVATATEEMTSTVSEIAQNAAKAKDISNEAVEQSNLTSKKINILGGAATKIGKVTEVISEISEQTNLLALNATIEAARAGEAGKGFAVVANEIKELAKQTAEATVDIKNQIDEMQTTTGSTITDIEKIGSIIEEINSVINTIATAVEQQSAATSEIAENIAQASAGIAEVNENVAQSSTVSSEISQEIETISNGAQEISQGSQNVKDSAAELSGLAEKLNSFVSRFKV